MEAKSESLVMDDEPPPSEVTVEDVSKRVDELRKAVQEGSAVTEADLTELRNSLMVVDARGRLRDKEVKGLQKVVASLHDRIRALESKDAGSILRYLNLTRSQLEEVTTRHDMQRTERAWTQETTGSSAGHSATVRGGEFDYQKRLMDVLTTQGQLKRPQKNTMLGCWLTKGGCVARSKESLVTLARNFLKKLESEDDGGLEEEQLVKAREFLETPLNELTQLPREEVFHAVTRSIPNDEWLEFARSALEIDESMIEQTKRQCHPTREQLRQLNKAFDKWRSNGNGVQGGPIA